MKSGHVLTYILILSLAFPALTLMQCGNIKQQVKENNIVGVKMVSIPGGKFQMGQLNVTEPVHIVTLSDFKMSAFEITQGQYYKVMGSNPSAFEHSDTLPVENVSWYDAIKFCNAFSAKAGLDICYDETTGVCDFSKNGFRLPTEAEWEYACRAGTKTIYNLGSGASNCVIAGWINTNSKSKTHTVGGKTPNAWGLYDMHGNVYEWCNDWYGIYSYDTQTNPNGAQEGSNRVIRGGSWLSGATYCRSADRYFNQPDKPTFFIGFRIVRRDR